MNNFGEVVKLWILKDNCGQEKLSELIISSETPFNGKTLKLLGSCESPFKQTTHYSKGRNWGL